MNRRTLALALTTLLATTPACMFLESGTAQENNPNTNNATNNANNTNNTSVTGGPNNTTNTNNATNNATNNSNNSNNIIGSACDPETDEILCGGEAECCNGTCVDTFEDPLNCGSCGFECGDGQECYLGMCVAGEEDCEPAEVQISPTNRDVVAFPRPLLIPADDQLFACFLFGPECPLSPEYEVPDIEDAAYLAFYGTAESVDEGADTINGVLVDERGAPMENSLGTISNPGFELIGMRATAVSNPQANTAQLAALWRQEGSTRRTQLALYDIPSFTRQFPGASLGTTTQPSVVLADGERIVSFDVVQLPLAGGFARYNDVRAVVFGIVENPIDLNSEGMFRLFFTLVGRRGMELEQIIDPEVNRPYVVVSERVPIGARANFSITNVTLGDSIVGMESNEEGEMVPVTQSSAFVAISAPVDQIDGGGERAFLFNNFLLPTDDEFGNETGIEPVYDTFRRFDRGWTPDPERNPSDAYMPITLLQESGEAFGGVGAITALTTSADPDQQNRNNTSISVSILAANVMRSMPLIIGPDPVFARTSYSFSALIEFAPWFEIPGLLGWLEGTVTEGVVGPERELRYSPVGGDEQDGPDLGAQQVLVGLDESQWVESYDTATGGRSYGVLMVTKLGANAASQARFRAISADGRPVCTLED